MRRRRFRITCALALASWGALCLQPVARAADRSGQGPPILRSSDGTRLPGQQLWASRYNGPGNGEDWAIDLGVSPGGQKVFVTGWSAGLAGDLDYTTVAYRASTGARLWASRYDGPGRGTDMPRALQVSPDGTRVFVTGNSVGSTGNYDYATVAYDAANGSQLWVTRYNGPGNDFDTPYTIGVSPDGALVFVSGYTTWSTGGRDYGTVAYESSTGMQVWGSRYDGPAHGDDLAVSLAASPGGSRVFVTGYSDDSGSATDMATIAYDVLTGTQIWVSRYDGPGKAYDIGNAVAVSPGGSRVFASGYSTGLASHEDATTVAYDAATGEQAWVSRYDGPGSGYDSLFDLQVAPGGSSVFATGGSLGSTTNYDYVTLSLNASTGVIRWVQRYNGQGNSEDFGEVVGVSPGGSTVVVSGGAVELGGYEDYTTVAYGASTGALRWVSSYDGPGHNDDAPFALDVAPGGTKLFVTGESFGSTTDRDYATVAYSIA